jgi:DNA-binding response OmpR family regulator
VGSAAPSGRSYDWGIQKARGSGNDPRVPTSAKPPRNHVADTGQGSPSVLVVDKEAPSRGRIAAILRRGGMPTIEAMSAGEALRVLYEQRPDLVVLDTALPDMNGYEAIRYIRLASDVPIVVVSAASTEAEKVHALRAGADDYVVKPPAPAELVARAEALARRRRTEQDQSHLVHGDITIDLGRVEARVAGHPLKLSPLEFRLLTTFVRNPRKVLSRSRLLATVWGDRTPSRDGDARVKIAIGYLRKRFRDVGVEPPIETVRGFGYRYPPPNR